MFGILAMIAMFLDDLKMLPAIAAISFVVSLIAFWNTDDEY